MSLDFSHVYFKHSESYQIRQLEAGYVVDDAYLIHDLSKQANEPSYLYSMALILAAGTTFNFETWEQEFCITLMDDKRNKETFTLTMENASNRVSQSRQILA